MRLRIRIAGLRCVAKKFTGIPGIEHHATVFDSHGVKHRRTGTDEATRRRLKKSDNLRLALNVGGQWLIE
jgi:hypothetical protein